MQRSGGALAEGRELGAQWLDSAASRSQGARRGCAGGGRFVCAQEEARRRTKAVGLEEGRRRDASSRARREGSGRNATCKALVLAGRPDVAGSGWCVLRAAYRQSEAGEFDLSTVINSLDQRWCSYSG